MEFDRSLQQHIPMSRTDLMRGTLDLLILRALITRRNHGLGTHPPRHADRAAAAGRQPLSAPGIVRLRHTPLPDFADVRAGADRPNGGWRRRPLAPRGGHRQLLARRRPGSASSPCSASRPRSDVRCCRATTSHGPAIRSPCSTTGTARAPSAPTRMSSAAGCASAARPTPWGPPNSSAPCAASRQRSTPRTRCSRSSTDPRAR